MENGFKSYRDKRQAPDKAQVSGNLMGETKEFPIPKGEFRHRRAVLRLPTAS